ncbi:MAG: histidine kinase [Acidobacteria bacterium]|nr:MAG: histidine kinase [Acidobacteriota bacterium]
MGTPARVLALLVVLLPPAARAARLDFERISGAQGLSQSIIEAIHQDRRGFLWFATEDGLNRWDGYRFTVFRSSVGDPRSLSYNDLKCVAEDASGALWIGTFEGGLNRFDPATGWATRYRNDPADPASLPANTVRAVLVDRDGKVWVGTQGGGLSRLDPGTGRFDRFRHDPAVPESLAGDDVRALLLDSCGVLWVGTWGGGLDRFDPQRRSFVHVGVDGGRPASAYVGALFEDRSGTLWAGTNGDGLLVRDAERDRLVRHPRAGGVSSGVVRAVTEDHDGLLWVATDGGGLVRLDVRTGETEVFRHDPAAPRSLATDRTWSLLEDRSGVLWVGTYGGGLNRLDLGKKKFLHLRHDPRDPASLGHDIVWSFAEDEDGTVWVGTDSAGLQRWDRRRNAFRAYRHDPRDPASLSHDAVRCVLVDGAGELWVGTNGGGLDRLDRATGRFTHHRHDPSDPGSLAHDELRALYEDRHGTLWVGTYGGGLDRLDRATGRFVHHRNDPGDPKSLSNDFVRCVLEDRSGRLWVGTQGGGLNRLDRATGTFARWPADPAREDALSSDFVFALHEDRDGALWIGTYGGGLNRLDPSTGRFSRFTTADGLSSDAVYGILEDERGRLWLGTNRGLTTFDPRERSHHVWDARDGLQSDEFNGGAYFRSARGEMFFGGINGFNAFFPADIEPSSRPAPVVLTGLLLFNQPVGVGPDASGRTLLSRFVGYADEVVLSHEDDVVSIEFAALHFAAPEKNGYAYRLDRFDRDWIAARADRRVATYTDLPPGSYLFRVKASNPDGVWGSGEARLRIVVTPPVWGTWWFRLGAALLVAAAVALGLRRRLRTVGMEAALKAAHEAQMALMPHEDPVVRGFEVSGTCIPALDVGGDFVDFVEAGLPDEPLGIVVGDVSGKGTGAAMAAALSSGMVNALVRSGAPPESVLERANTALRTKIDRRMFAAVCLASLDPLHRTLTFVNAGLCEPLLRSGDVATYLTTEGTSFPLGSYSGSRYLARTVPLSTGDVVVLYTDGVPEATDRGGTQWGYDALAGFLRGLPAASLTARQIRDAIVAEVHRVSGGPGLADDVALVVVKAV